MNLFKLLRRRRPARQPAPATAKSLQLEQLEQRDLLAAADLALGVLTINFEATGADTEDVTITSSGGTITLSGDVFGDTSVSASAVNRIQFSDIGGSSNQSLTFATGDSFSLTGGLSSSGVETLVLGADISTSGADIVADPTNVVLAASVTIDTAQSGAGGAVDFGSANISANAAGYSLKIDTVGGSSAAAGRITLGNINNNTAGTVGGSYINDLTLNANSTSGTDGVITLGTQIFTDDDGSATFGAASGDVTIAGDWQLTASTQIVTNQPGWMVTSQGQTGFIDESHGGTVTLTNARISATASNVDLTIDTSVTTVGNTPNLNGGRVQFGIFDDVGGGSLVNNVTFVTAGGGAGGEAGDLFFRGALEIAGTFESVGAGYTILWSGSSLTAGSAIIQATGRRSGDVSFAGSALPPTDDKDGADFIMQSGTSISTTVGALTLSADGDMILFGLNPIGDVFLTSAVDGGGSVTLSEALAFSGATEIVSDTTIPSSDITFESTATWVVNLNGSTPGTGFDQLTVSGNVNLGDATLELNEPTSFTPNIGDQFTLVTGASSLTGTFAGLAEGGWITSSNGTIYSITYQGGEGNDVVLTTVFVGSTTSLLVDVLGDVNDGDFSTGNLSLREAIELANFDTNTTTITFHTDLSGDTIQLAGTELEITTSVTITGLGADLLKIDAGGASRVFLIDDSGDGTNNGNALTVAISSLTITGGNSTTDDGTTNFGRGGGILNYENLTLNEVAVSGNETSSDGGGIWSRFGNLTLSGSTISGNVSKFHGGGVYVRNSQVEVLSSTISGNVLTAGNSGVSGGGIYATGSNLDISHSTITGNAAQTGGGLFGVNTLDHSIVAGNTAGTAAPDISGNVTATYSLIGNTSGANVTGSGNILNQDPMLGSLANNGGPTQTHALLESSPAIDAGNPTASPGMDDVPTTDQRGFARLVGIAIDIGAVELETPPSLAITADAVSKDEGNTGTTDFTFTVTRSGNLAGAASVDYTVSGTLTAAELASSATGTVNFANGESTKTITVTINADTVVENDDTLTVTLSNPSLYAEIGTESASTTVTNDDSATLILNLMNASQEEGDSSTTDFTFEVVLSNAVEDGLTVAYSTSDITAIAGQDYTSLSDILTFTGTANETKTITVQVNGDQVVENTEQFRVELGTITTANMSAVTISTGSQVGEIINDDFATVSFSQTSVSALEGDSGNTSITFDVVLDKAVDTPFSVSFFTSDGTATAGTDYESQTGSLNFSGTVGETQSITIIVYGDQIVEPDETFQVTLGGISGGISGAISVDGTQATGTITNDDTATLTLTPINATQLEGDTGTTDFTFAVTLDREVQGGLDITYATSDLTAIEGEDYGLASGTLSFTGTANETQTITVLVYGDAVIEGDEAFSIALDVLTAPNADAIAVDTTPEIATITNDDSATLTLTPINATQLEGDTGTTEFTFAVTLDRAVQGGLEITYFTSDGTATSGVDYELASGTLSFTGTANETQTITVLVYGDSIVEGDETFSVALGALTATNPAEITVDATPETATISNDDGANVSLSSITLSQPEGNSGTTEYTFTVTLDADVQDGFRVSYTTADGTATTSDQDYAPNSGELNFVGTAGETLEFSVFVNGDTAIESDETFLVRLFGLEPVASNVRLSNAEVTVQIENDERLMVTAPGAGSRPEIVVLHAVDGREVARFLAYDEGFSGGVQVAVGDINGDNVDDVITAAGPGGGPHVKVFDGLTGNVIASFFAYDAAFTGGVFVAVGDLNADGFDDLVTGAGAGGGPHVRAFDGQSLSHGQLVELASFFAYDAAFTGGVRVAVADVNGDTVNDIITGAGPGGGPHVKAFDLATGSELASFFAYDSGFTGGVFVAAGDTDRDGIDEIITGAGAGGGPHVKVFEANGAELQSFFAYDPGFLGGVHVAAGDVDGNLKADILTGAGPGGGPHVKVFDGQSLEVYRSFYAFNADFDGGVFLSGGVSSKEPTSSLAPLRIAGGPLDVQAEHLTEEQLALVYQQAVAAWGDPSLASVPVVIRDLPGDLLGLGGESGVIVDIDAAGHGWALSEEDLAEGRRVDLLTVVAHELGHVLGLPDLDAAAHDLMAAELEPGVRKLPRQQ